MDYVESNGHVTDDVTWPWKVMPNTLRAQYRENSWRCLLLISLLWGSTVGYCSDSLASCLNSAPAPKHSSIDVKTV